jgi:ribosomal protein S18 acetylase RimI-like enzyme
MLADFPPAAHAPPAPYRPLAAKGMSLRAAASGDLPFLRDLYAGFRAAKLALAPWPEAQKRAFVDDQFRLQHEHFTRHHPRADFWVVMQAPPLSLPRPIGRLYLDRSAKAWHIVDIGLLREMQGQGLGSAMLAWIQDSAAAAGASVSLQVALNNPRARALYLRQGFRETGPSSATHQPMAWRVPVS